MKSFFLALLLAQFLIFFQNPALAKEPQNKVVEICSVHLTEDYLSNTIKADLDYKNKH